MSHLPDVPAEKPTPEESPGRFRPWIVPAAAFVVGLLLGVVLGVAVGGGTGDKADEAASAVSPVIVTVSPEPTSATGSTPEVSPSPSPEQQAGRLTKQDIELSLKTTERQCFGSAGCNVTVQVRIAVDAAVIAALPASGTWDVTYQIDGDDSGPIIGTFSIYPNGKYDVNEEYLSTASVNTPVRVKVIDVERFGG